MSGTAGSTGLGAGAGMLLDPLAEKAFDAMVVKELMVLGGGIRLIKGMET